MSHVTDVKVILSRLYSMKHGLSSIRINIRNFSENINKPPQLLHKESVTPLPPLSEPMPNLPPVVYASPKSEEYGTEVTVLSNGFRVASEKKFGQFCTAGVVIDSGPRYEVAYPNGICHFLEKLSFGATNKFPTRDVMLRELEKHGGICDCQGSRDTTVYATSADSKGLEAITQLCLAWGSNCNKCPAKERWFLKLSRRKYKKIELYTLTNLGLLLNKPIQVTTNQTLSLVVLTGVGDMHKEIFSFYKVAKVWPSWAFTVLE